MPSIDADVVLVAEGRDSEIDAGPALFAWLGLGVFDRPARVQNRPPRSGAPDCRPWPRVALAARQHRKIPPDRASPPPSADLIDRITNPPKLRGFWRLPAAIPVRGPAGASRAGARHSHVSIGVDDRVEPRVGAIPCGRVDSTVDAADDISRLGADRATAADVDPV